MARRVIIDGVEVDLGKIARENQRSQTNEEETSQRYSFRASSLRIDGISAERVNIWPHTSNEIIVVVSGLQSAVKAVNVEAKGDTVMIGGRNDSHQSVQIGGMRIRNCGSVLNSFSGGSIMVNDGVTIISGGGDININTSGSTSKSTLDIKVPIGTDIDYDANGGVLTIGDVQGDVQLDTSGHTEMHIGQVKSLDLDTSGNAIADVQRVDGDVSIDASGNCDIRISEGSISRLKVDLSGMGKVNVCCTAQRANLDVSGMGNIYVAHVVKPPRKDCSGMGSIRIGHVG